MNKTEEVLLKANIDTTWTDDISPEGNPMKRVVPVVTSITENDAVVIMDRTKENEANLNDVYIFPDLKRAVLWLYDDEYQRILEIMWSDVTITVQKSLEGFIEGDYRFVALDDGQYAFILE